MWPDDFAVRYQEDLRIADGELVSCLGWVSTGRPGDDARWLAADRRRRPDLARVPR
jgi:hypothetical protein